MNYKVFADKLWIGAALTVLLIPMLIPRALDAISENYPTKEYQPPNAASSLTSLPNDLPAKLEKTEMVISHYRLPGGNFLSQYTNTLSDNNKGLVPYIPRLYDNEDYTLTESDVVYLNGQAFTKNIVRRKYSNKSYVLLYSYWLGSIQVGSYTKAKLYQLPAAFVGASQFRLSVLQARCKKDQCDEATQTLEELVPNLS